MEHIRQASAEDLARIAEIEIFNYRLNFYPIFQNDAFYFGELQVTAQIEKYRNAVESLWVYDDGAVKWFIQAQGRQVRKLFVEPALQGRSIGAALLEYAIDQWDVRFLWALEKNTRAIAFYRSHGFRPMQERRLEEGTAEYLVRLERA